MSELEEARAEIQRLKQDLTDALTTIALAVSRDEAKSLVRLAHNEALELAAMTLEATESLVPKGQRFGLQECADTCRELKVPPVECQHEVCVGARAGKQIMGPSHHAKSGCESGGHPHCTCDLCW